MLGIIKEWSVLLVPWFGIIVTAYLTLRVRRVAEKVVTQVEGVHKLVNSEMMAFRKLTDDFYKAREDQVFRAGQQQVRDNTRSVVLAAAGATTAAAVATTAAADATTAAATIPPVLPTA